MLNNDTRKELTDIICGNVIEREGCYLTTTRNYLCKSFSTSTTVEKNFEFQSKIKEEQRQQLVSFINGSPYRIININEAKYLTEGGEAKVYFGEDNKTVIKLNDAIYYNNWLDFLNSILIHNLLFEKTAYKLLGFIGKDANLYAVLEQPFIVNDQPTDLADVKIFLEFNGFKNIRRNDYYNIELGLILEDMHDENVLVNSGILFFIDTVFYINIL